MPIWNKPIKFVYLQKLANQSVLHGANLKEMAKRSTVVFMKKRKSLVVWWREKNVSWKKQKTKQKNPKKHRMVEIFIYLTLVLKDFSYGWPSTKWNSWNDKDLLVKVIIGQQLIEKVHDQNYWCMLHLVSICLLHT